MATTITSTLVAGVLAGTTTFPYTPGRVQCTVASMSPFSASQTVTVGQVIQMVPLPTGARVLDVVVTCNMAAATAGIFTVGDGGSTARYIGRATASLSTSKVVHMDAGLGYKYSLSDDIQNPLLKFDTVDITIGAGTTQTFTGSFMMQVYWVYEKET